MAVELVLDTVEFPCEPWVIRGPEILPQAGTWTIAPRVTWDFGAKGIIACPRCAQAFFVLHDMGEKAEDLPLNLVLKQWLCGKCHFRCRAILVDWDKRILYCAAYETMVDGVLTANKAYMHAESIEDATSQFWNGRIAADNVVSLVAVAQVIGYFVQDNQGRKLSVD